MNIRIGIDPGIHGALACLTDSTCQVVDMPVMIATGKRFQVNAAELGKIIKKWSEGNSCIAYLERVSAMPLQGVSSMFSFGVSYGIVQGVLGALQIPVVLATPTTWKKRAGLLGKEKDAARTLAQQLFPQVELSRKKDIGRAEALLIAKYGGG